jgi:hypothetical protein
MAASTQARTGSVQTRRTSERLTTETKHSFKTTEFAAMVAVIAGILISAALIKGGDTTGGAGAGGTDEFTAHQAWLYVAIVAAGYMISRGLAKAGSRDPYWADGTNQNRDTNGDNR